MCSKQVCMHTNERIFLNIYTQPHKLPMHTQTITDFQCTHTQAAAPARLLSLSVFLKCYQQSIQLSEDTHKILLRGSRLPLSVELRDKYCSILAIKKFYYTYSEGAQYISHMVYLGSLTDQYQQVLQPKQPQQFYVQLGVQRKIKIIRSFLCLD